MLDLTKQARQCNFQGLFKFIVLDQIAIGINGKKRQETLLQNKDLTLPKAVKVRKAGDAAALQRENKSEEFVGWVASYARPGG